ncbi:MAG: hypothetical protein IKV94_04865 [Clostridia bacterium]|nr:hypothetical protein [Clostridia bacterium]
MEIQNYSINNSTEINAILNSGKTEIVISDYLNTKDNEVKIDLSKYKDNKPTRRIIKGSIINE